MSRRCANIHEKVSHSRVVLTTGRHAGLCCACVGRLTKGNRTKGAKKRRASLLGIGHALSRCGKQVSAAAGGFDAHRHQLLQFLAQGAGVSTVDRYVDKLIRETLERRAAYVQRVTVVEAPCDEDSEIAQANADLQGASLRITKPSGDQEPQPKPPALVCGSVVSWPLDVLTVAGRNTLSAYLGAGAWH